MNSGALRTLAGSSRKRRACQAARPKALVAGGAGLDVKGFHFAAEVRGAGETGRDAEVVRRDDVVGGAEQVGFGDTLDAVRVTGQAAGGDLYGHEMAGHGGLAEDVEKGLRASKTGGVRASLCLQGTPSNSRKGKSVA